MDAQGYYRYPTLFQNKIVFVSDDDLWETSINGGPARRLTNSRSLATTPVFSPDGTKVAFASGDEGGLEVFTLDLKTGQQNRLTYLGDTVMLSAWTDQGIYFSGPSGKCLRVSTLWRVSETGGIAESLNWGPGQNIAFNTQGVGTVIQRHGYREYGYWKRYRGGTAGEIWIDPENQGDFKKLIDLKSNLAKPLWLKGRIYFVSDHEGIGNLYSSTIEGQDLQRHTHHTDYYVRNQSTDGHKIVYHAGGDLFVYDPDLDTSSSVPIHFSSPRMQQQRKWMPGSDTVYDYALHPKGQHLASTHRGKLLTYNAFEGPIVPLGESLEKTEKRYRHCAWLKDGKRLIASHTQDNQDVFEIFDAETGESLDKSPLLDIGRINQIKINPQLDVMAMINHRAEILMLDLATWTLRLVDRSPYGDIASMDWSADGLWLAYDCTIDRRRTAIKMAGISDTAIHQVTDPVLKDFYPTFDPEGKYLYFLSCREFTPSHDSLHFELGFPAGMRPYMVTLDPETPNPLVARYQIKDTAADDDDEVDGKEDAKEDEKKAEKIDAISIVFKGITERIIALPIEPGQFSHAVALKGKLIYLTHPILDSQEDDGPEDMSPLTLEVFDLETKKTDEFLENIHSFDVSLDRKFLIYESRKKLRIIKSLEKPDDTLDTPSKKSGWSDLSRLKIMIDPLKEWRQIYNEAWRLQKDQFWLQDMAGVDWDLVYKRYLPQLGRISTRRELTDILWEMQGELGTSHAYVAGGDFKSSPQWSLGFLGATFSYDTKEDCYRIATIIKGDIWDRKTGSPLAKPGVQATVGDKILAINGQKPDHRHPIESMLIAQSKQDILITLQKQDETTPRQVTVTTIATQHPAEYRDWVNHNRRYIHEKSQGKVGYIHIPDMSTEGYAEFHRGFLAECDRPGLIVDVRFNGGGSVSQLLLEKLARRRLGYDLTRWNDRISYPMDASHGRLVALTNEYAGSDGDMFSAMFKAMRLGPLIGKRTWGGVIGIWPKHGLIDDGYTTQPEYSFWSFAEGWSIENYGVDPDIEVDITPQDYKADRDPQLDRSLKEVLKILEENPIQEPDFSKPPRLPLPQGLEVKKS